MAKDIKHQTGFGAVTAFGLVFLYAPIVILCIFAFNSGNAVLRWEGFSARWFGIALQNEELLEALKNTLTISIPTTLMATALATLAALGLTRIAVWRGMRFSAMLINLPLMVPEIITAVASLSFFSLLAGYFGINFGIGNLIIVHTVFCIPFAFMPIRARLQDMDLNLEQAAGDLYASPAQVFRYVTFPLLRPGIFSGAALAFIVSFDDFTITQLVAGPGQTTLPLFIWGLTRKPITPEINAISAMLIAVSISFVVLSFMLANRNKAIQS